jgi:uncharacterized protein
MEEHFFLEVSGCRLAAVLHHPDGGATGQPGLVLLHGWAGYRAGAHQMFVKLGREAARQGYACLRFDFRGRGDSEGDAGAATLTTMIQDALAAGDALRQRAGCAGYVFVGDCSGSEVAIGAGPLAEGCQGLALWSAPLVGASREEADRAKRQHILRQYWQKLFRRETWAKLASGSLQGGAIRRALLRGGKGKGEEGDASDKQIDWARRFGEFSGEVLFVFGGADPTTAEGLRHYEALTAQAGRAWHCHVVEGANHAFYSTAWEREVIGATLDWVREAGLQG